MSDHPAWRRRRRPRRRAPSVESGRPGSQTAPRCPSPLDEEQLVEAALAGDLPAHARSCPECAARFEAAVAVLHSDGVEAPERAAARRRLLSPVLDAALDAERRPARVHVTLATSTREMAFRGEGLEFRFRDPEAPALRRESALDAPLTFRRRFAEVELRFQLVAEGDRFRLVVEAAGALPERTDVALSRRGRELASQRLREVPSVFPGLPPDRYELILRRGGVTLARAEIEVEPDPSGAAS